MDPRISVGQNYVYITLKDGSIWKAKRPQEGGYVDKYLYPDRSSTEYYGLAPVFGLGDDKYYFIDQNKLTVVFLPGPTEPTPEKPAGGTTGLSRKTLGVEISILVFASLSLIFIAGFSKKL